jgi:hypothetical protein
MQLLPRLIYPRPITSINDKDKALSASVVVPPQWTDLVLAADIPDVEFAAIDDDSFDVETDGGDCGYVLVEFDFVEDGLNTEGMSVTGQNPREVWERVTDLSFRRRRDRA